MARRMGLPRAETLDVVCRRDLRAPMDDGVVLLADRWVARETADRPSRPCSCARPTGGASSSGCCFGRLLAERGLQVGHPERARHVRLRRQRSARSTSEPTGWRRCAGCARSRGTPGRSRCSVPAIWASCSGRSREPAGRGAGGDGGLRSPPRSSTTRPTPARACRWRHSPRGWSSSPCRSAGWGWCRSTAPCGGWAGACPNCR